ncbi:transporter substrate-binding domain-containing protein [Syntrophomonas curvata]
MNRIRFTFAPVVVLLTFIVCLPSAFAQRDIGLQVQGKLMGIEPAPYIDGDRVMVPVREVAGNLGAEVTWDGEKQAVKVVRGEYQITMVIGQTQAVVNGENVQLEGAPVITDGRAMAPVRVLADGLQVPVSWDSATRVVSLGKSALVAGSSLDFPPFEYKEGNDIVGFDIDLIMAIEEMWEEDIAIQDISFDRLIPSLLSGQVDLIVSGLTITESRREVIDFTIPYFEWGEIILTPKGADNDMVLEDLAGQKIAVQGGTTAHDLVVALAKKHPDTQLILFDSLEEVWAAVEENKAYAAVVPYPLTAHYLNTHRENNLQLVGKVFSVYPEGIAVQKGNQELLDKLNKSLETLKENGTYDRLWEKWFGSGR